MEQYINLSRETLIQNLKDAGCNQQEIASFLDKKDKASQIRFLKCYRCQLLEQVHEVNKKIDCLDYLLYLLKRGKADLE
ncbi:hypothetical protein [uncultured Thomasclavelia sp.]|uniref:hypothetical protein n=1 Tax=uncultured Thomasclavelia sp. TaxID=3025759 RepID=UPI0025E2C142|nr:hypothetical protein [uncultured Thomasclavelia sp.]